MWRSTFQRRGDGVVVVVPRRIAICTVVILVAVILTAAIITLAILSTLWPPSLTQTCTPRRLLAASAALLHSHSLAMRRGAPLGRGLRVASRPVRRAKRLRSVESEVGNVVHEPAARTR